MPKFPLRFVRCLDCGHVFNEAFDYEKVPYGNHPNRMFNGGRHWARFLEGLRSKLLSRLPATPTVVEVGHGDGGFLEAMADARKDGRFIGFDPHGAEESCRENVSYVRSLFSPEEHLGESQPHLLLMRHVLEHLSSPLRFLQRVMVAASFAGVEPLVYAEAPCIDRALKTGRTEDFYYEHNSHFTTASFTRMLERCGGSVEEIGHGSDGEVVYGLLGPAGREFSTRIAQDALAFAEMSATMRESVMRDLESLHRAGKRVAFWGGTGKAAAFMQTHGVDAERFPLVVDSDARKVGTFVPGTGQRIEFRDVLREEPADVIIASSYWRARDVFEESIRCGITFDRLLVPFQGCLADFKTRLQ